MFHNIDLASKIWLPNFWFIINTIAIQYPNHPNEVTKKKYYEFFQNIPVFFPMEPLGNTFVKVLDKYPVNPYLNNRHALMRWVHFIYNQITNPASEQKITLGDYLEKYYHHYIVQEVEDNRIKRKRRKIINFSILVLVFGIGIVLYRKTNTD